MSFYQIFVLIIMITGYTSSLQVKEFSYEEALKHCSLENAHLPRVGNNSEYIKVILIAAENNINEFWLQSFQYNMGPFSFEGNTTYEPVFSHVNGDCGLLDSAAEEHVHSRTCRSELGYICSYFVDENHCSPLEHKIGKECYEESTELKSWLEAKLACKGRKKTLAVFYSNGEILQLLTSIRALRLKVKQFWINLKRDNSGSGWMDEEPKSHRKGESAVIAVRKGHTNEYLWKTVSKHKKYATICTEKEGVLETTNVYTLYPLGTSIDDASGSKQSKAEPLHQISIIIPVAIALAILILILLGFILRFVQKKRSYTNDSQGYQLASTAENSYVNIQEKRVLLLGEISAGKSTLINSSIFALGASAYCQWAKIGRYGKGMSGSITRKITPYALQKHPKSPGLQGENLGKLGENQVITFWDTPGLWDGSQKELEVFLKRILCGKIPRDTTYDDLKSSSVKCQNVCCSLYDNCRRSPHTIAFDCIILVHNILKEIPYEIAKTLTDTHRKLNAEILVISVLTHIDLVGDEDIRRYKEEIEQMENEYEDNQSENLEEIAEENQETVLRNFIEYKFKKLQSLLGISKDNCFCIKQYCSDTTTTRDQDIDDALNRIITFITRNTKPT